MNSLILEKVGNEEFEREEEIDTSEQKTLDDIIDSYSDTKTADPR